MELGGGLYLNWNSNALVYASWFEANTAVASGGGIRSNGADPVIAFNVITGSTPTGLMLSYDDGGVVTNNVLDGNHDAGIYTFTVAGYGNPTTAILNNIVVDHAVGVHFTTDATLVQAFSNNDVWDNGTGYNLAMNPTVVWNGVDGNISADPLFTFSTPRDYYLQPLSPCVGAGLTGNNVTTWTSTWGYTVTEDYTGRVLATGNPLDMGAIAR